MYQARTLAIVFKTIQRCPIKPCWELCDAWFFTEWVLWVSIVPTATLQASIWDLNDAPQSEDRDNFNAHFILSNMWSQALSSHRSSHCLWYCKMGKAATPRNQCVDRKMMYRIARDLWSMVILVSWDNPITTISRSFLTVVSLYRTYNLWS